MALDHPEIAEIDVNPLLVDGARPIAVDALVTLGEADRGPMPRLAVDLASLDAVFAAGSVAIVGASANPAKWGGQIMLNILTGGYEGAVYPVNGRGGEIFGKTGVRVDQRPARRPRSGL